MKLGRLLLLFLLVSPTGCSFLGYGVHNTISAPFDAVQECVFRHRVRNLARTAWRTIACAEGRTFSSAYERGFEDGFVDYVDANGTGEPPAMPPAWLRRGLLRSDQGQNDIEDWFAGFRHGARAARESGLREHVVMPIGLPPRTPAEPLPAQVVVPIPGVKEMPPAQAAPFPIKEREPDPVTPVSVKQGGTDPVAPIPVTESGPAPIGPIPVLEGADNRVPAMPPSRESVDRVPAMPPSRESVDRVPAMPPSRESVDRVPVMPPSRESVDRVPAMPPSPEPVDRVPAMPPSRESEGPLLPDASPGSPR